MIDPNRGQKGRKMTEVIRKLLETHKIQIDMPQYGSDQPWVPHKCTGCPWIGWDHVDHLAAMIEKAVR